MRNAKIVCTLGPSCSSTRTVRDMVEAGMTVARINTSHGNPDTRKKLIEVAREVDEATETPLGVMVDIQGPEVRTAETEEKINLKNGSKVRFVESETVSEEEIGVSEDISAVSVGDQILLDDGRIEAVVEKVEGGTVYARVEDGGELGSRKGVNIPDVNLGLGSVTEKDREDLKIAAQKEVDFVAASFVRSGEDILEIKDLIDSFGEEDIPVIAKIERVDAVRNLDEIIDESYGTMVARGDLGVECPMEEVPMIQKRIIRRCREEGVPVITATEMLDSMVHERRPTRAEASDVANAVLDGTDAVMLSAETAVGDHPVRVVETMDKLIREVESSDEYTELREQRVPMADQTGTDALARSARFLARDVGASAVVTASESGYTALKTAKFRPGVPVVATTPRDRVRRRLALSWGVYAQHTEYTEDGAQEVIEDSVQSALESGLAESGDTVVVLSGMMTEMEGTDTTNMMKVHVAAEIIATGKSIVSGQAIGKLRKTDGDLSEVEEGEIIVLEKDVEEFEGEVKKIGGVISPESSMTNYAAIVARELGIPMIGGVDIGEEVQEGDTVTIDGERGVVYEGDVSPKEERRRRYDN